MPKGDIPEPPGGALDMLRLEKCEGAVLLQ